jgi:Spy/CpxP family protein refolding chaperone
LPDQGFTLTLEAPGYQSSSQDIKLPEGEKKELTVTLKPAATTSDSTGKTSSVAAPTQRGPSADENVASTYTLFGASTERAPDADKKPATPKANEPAGKTSSIQSADKTSRNGENLSDEWSAARQALPTGFLQLPAYSKLMSLDARTHFGINAEQEKKLREISTAFVAMQGKAIKYYEETQKLSPQERKKKGEEFGKQLQEQVKTARKQVEDVLTAQQREAYKRDYCYDLAIALCGDPRGSGKALGLTLTKRQEQQLAPLMMEYWESNRKKQAGVNERLLAVLTPQQREKLTARLTDVDVTAPSIYIPAPAGGVTGYIVPAGEKPEPSALVFAFPSNYGANVSVYPDLMFPAIRKELALTGDEEAKLQAVLVKSRSDAQKVFDQFQPEIGAKHSPEEQKSQRAELQRSLERFGKEVIANIDAVLQPQQVASLMLFARKDKSFVLLATQDHAVLDDLKITAEQRAQLRRIDDELASPSPESTRTTAEKALAILTPEQRKKLDEAIQRFGM